MTERDVQSGYLIDAFEKLDVHQPCRKCLLSVCINFIATAQPVVYSNELSIEKGLELALRFTEGDLTVDDRELFPENCCVTID